ncbi:hypothetical protein E2C01_055114 [Portunus trituberculatus]|uniref:Uncharacterized protein n=1 Tax=Portunus trituberculatus TaxID=210409 RepID=A0A5B7GLR7_PORTR|nr:hypothetical protein [Portunus trituberculatus]
MVRGQRVSLILDEEDQGSSRIYELKEVLLGYLFFESPPTRELLPLVRKPYTYIHSDHGQDSNLCAWKPLRPQSVHGFTVPQRPICEKAGGRVRLS